MRICRWLNEKPLVDIYRLEQKICRVAVNITGLFTFACLVTNVPARSTVPWAVMFGMSLAALPLLTLLIETQSQVDEELAWRRNSASTTDSIENSTEIP